MAKVVVDYDILRFMKKRSYHHRYWGLMKNIPLYIVVTYKREFCGFEKRYSILMERIVGMSRRKERICGLLFRVLLWLIPVLSSPMAAASVPYVKGPALRSGDYIGIAAPAGSADGIDITQATALLQAAGYQIKFPAENHKPYGYFAGTDEERARELNALFADPQVRAILCLNGGYGSARILDTLDYDLIRSHPKMVIGFSDITALHTALGEKSHMVTVYGPMVITLRPGSYSDYTWRQFTQGISSADSIGAVVLPKRKQLTSLIPGKASGRLVGGNLSMLAAAAGTPYELRGDGGILVLEDVNEPSYRIDRMLWQLWQNGLLKRVNGIVYGEFLNCTNDSGDFTVDEVLVYYAKLSGKPVIKGLPVGHGVDNMFLPLGVHAVMKGNADGTAVLHIDEPHAVQS